MKESRFQYSAGSLESGLKVRFYLLSALLFVFLGFNGYHLPPEKLLNFLLLSGTIISVMGFLLWRRYSLQKSVWANSFLDLKADSLIHSVNGVESWKIPFSEITDIHIDTYKGMKRISLSTNRGIVKLLQVNQMEELLESLQSKTKLLPRVLENTKYAFFHWKNLLYFSPTFVFLFFVLSNEAHPFFNTENYYLLLNVNALLFLIYLPRTMEMESDRKGRLIFLLLIAFGIQAYWRFTSSF